MVTNYNKQVPTVFVPQSIAPAGLRAHEMTSYSIGIMDCETNKTVDSASYSPDRKYEIILKTGNTGAENAAFPDMRGARLPIRLPLTKVYKAHSWNKASEKPKNFVAYLGWDGISDCKTLSLECGQDYGLQVTVRGESIRNVFNRNLTEIIPFRTGCCEDCNLEQSGEALTEAILKAFKTYSTPGNGTNGYYVTNYVDVSRVKSCCPTQVPFAKKEYRTWTLEIADNGTQSDLAKVQSQYVGYKVSQVKREAPYTTYEVSTADLVLTEVSTSVDMTAALNTTVLVDTTAAPVTITVPVSTSTSDYIKVVDEGGVAGTTNIILTGAFSQTINTNYDSIVLQGDGATGWVVSNLGVAPADYTQTRAKLLICDECPDCPSGFTKTPAGDRLVVVVDSPADLGVDTFAEFNSDYYTSNAQATIDALVESTMIATVPGFISGTGSVISTDGDKLVLQVTVTSGTTITEHGITGVTLTKIGETEAYCQGSQTFSWCEKELFYTINRTKCITVKKEDCYEGVAVDANHNLYKEVYSLIEDNDTIDNSTFAVASDNDCLVKFTVTQESSKVQDGCDTFGKDGAKFDNNIPSYKGIFWQDCGCEGWTFDVDGCPVAPVAAASDNCLVGIKFEGKFINRETAQPCTYDIGDAIEREPIEVEVTLIRQYGDSDLCEPDMVDWTVVQYPTIQEGLGQFVKRKEVLSRKYDLGIYNNPKGEYGNLYNAKSGYEYATDPNKLYNHIDLYFTSDEDRNFYAQGSDSPIRNLLQLFVEAENGQLFNELKSFLNKTVIKHGLAKPL